MRSATSSWNRPTTLGMGRKPSAPPKRRVRPSLRPRLEDLEARVAMTASALDPSFGQGGVVLGPLFNGSRPLGSSIYAVTAVAVQGDGKIVEAETQGTNIAGTTVYPPLVVRRFNADGSVDATFGTGRVTAIPLRALFTDVSGPHNLVIEPNGDIVLAAAAYVPAPEIVFPGPSVDNVVVRLTANGQLDPGFGTNGEVNLPDPGDNLSGFNTVAVQGDGKIVVAGAQTVQPPTSTSPIVTYDTPQTAVVRLTTAGALDTTFHQTGELTIPLPNSLSSYSNPIGLTTAAVAIAPNGQIYVASNLRPGLADVPSIGELSRINTDGTLDASYGASGTLGLSLEGVGDMAIQADGKVVLAGTAGTGVVLINHQSYGAVVRLLPSGLPDPSFASIGSPSAQGTPNFTSIALAADGGIVVGGTVAITPYDRRALVERFLANGTSDPRFGVAGKISVALASFGNFGAPVAYLRDAVNSLALTPSGKIIVGGGVSGDNAPTPGQSFPLLSRTALAQLIPSTRQATPGDYNGDGRSDVVAILATFGAFAYRPSGGGADVIQPFGPAGVGQAIPAPGDYDGDGKTDIAAYLPAYGVLAYRPSSGGPDKIIPFGMAGAGKSIPAPGDYDGDGKTDVAVYLPSLGILAYRPSGGGPDVLTQFGFAGNGRSIPAPGDYDGDGKTDVAVYLPSLGILAYRPSSGGPDVLTQFGLAGAGKSIPAPGDYDGLGKTDIAVYMPGLGEFAYRPSNGGPDVLTQFGLAGAGKSIPAPGDYDGDGKTDLAVYLPSLGLFAYRPSSGGADVIEGFGASGTGQTVPAASIAYAQPATLSIASRSSTANGVNIPLTEDLLTTPLGSKKKPRA